MKKKNKVVIVANIVLAVLIAMLIIFVKVYKTNKPFRAEGTIVEVSYFSLSGSPDVADAPYVIFGVDTNHDGRADLQARVSPLLARDIMQECFKMRETPSDQPGIYDVTFVYPAVKVHVIKAVDSKDWKKIPFYLIEDYSAIASLNNNGK